MTALDKAVVALMRKATKQAILPRYRNLSEGEVEDKGGNDPVTIADREAEAILREGLLHIDRSLTVVGEEAAHEDPSLLDRLNGPCWIVDPVDGTRNFASGQPPFGVIIALSDGGLAQSGWLYDCLTGRVCIAHRGKGAFVDGERITSSGTGQTPPVAAISLTYMDADQSAKLARHVSPAYTQVDIPFCAAEQYPRLGLGQNDVSIFERTLPWDHAAGVLWLEEAGGKAARPDGTPYRVDEPVKRGLLGAATPALWEGLARRYAEI